MQDRNEAWLRDYGLRDCRYDWSLGDARLIFTTDSGTVSADIRVIGSASLSKGTFLWSWANETIPPQARCGPESVRAFGSRYGLTLLVTPEWPAGRDDALEIAAVAARLLDASGAWIEALEDVTLFFALSNFRRDDGRPSAR